MNRTLVLLVAANALSGCAAGFYEYDYDPWLGPYGHHVGGAFDELAHRPAPACRWAFSAPVHEGYRTPYVSGPYCVAAGPPPP